MTTIDAPKLTPNDGARKIAAANDLPLERRIELGRAVMITGPAWFGRLDLRGPERAAFNAYAAAKIARIKEQG